MPPRPTVVGGVVEPSAPAAHDRNGRGHEGPLRLYRHLPSSFDLPDGPPAESPAEESDDGADANEKTRPQREGITSQLLPEVMAAPRITAEASLSELASLSDREVREANADVLGRPAETDSGCFCDRMEQAVDDLETEMRRLCKSVGCRGSGRGDRSAAEALQRARRSLPFLASTSHARQFLIAEEMDAERAARRMARYCEMRERLDGSAAFEPDRTSLPPDEEIARIAAHCNFSSRRSDEEKDEDDAALDPETQRAAAKLLRNWEARKMDEMDAEVERMPLHVKATLLDARSRRPEEVYTVAQKRIFLRSAGFNPCMAAQRMANYWDMKYYLFGYDNAFKRVALSDEECPEMSQGIFYLLPGRDAFGRVLICCRNDRLFTHSSDGDASKRMLQVVWYVLHLARIQEGAWKNGAVLFVVMKGTSVRSFPSIDFVNKMSVILFKSVPLQIRAQHCCLPPDTWLFRILLSVSMLAIGREARSRKVVHKGKEEDVVSALEGTYGVSREQLPSVLGGTLDPHYGERWFDDQAEAVLAQNEEGSPVVQENRN